MSGNKGIGFAVNTAVKLSVYLLMCLAAFIFSGFIENAGRHFAPPVAAALITWLFLQFMEGGRRSFFAKGYMVENIVPGAVIGAFAAALPMVVELIRGRLSFEGFTSGVDIREPFYIVFRVSLFGGIVFFGYIFHILKHDVGNICAVTVSTVLYTAFSLISVGIEGAGLVISVNESAQFIYILSLILSGAAAGLCIIEFGDMRSGTAFICLKKLTEISAVGMMKLRYNGMNAAGADFMYSEWVCAAVLGVICVWLFVQAVKKG